MGKEIGDAIMECGLEDREGEGVQVPFHSWTGFGVASGLDDRWSPCPHTSIHRQKVHYRKKQLLSNPRKPQLVTLVMTDTLWGFLLQHIQKV